MRLFYLSEQMPVDRLREGLYGASCSGNWVPLKATFEDNVVRLDELEFGAWFRQWWNKKGVVSVWTQASSRTLMNLLFWSGRIVEFFIPVQAPIERDWVGYLAKIRSIL